MTVKLTASPVKVREQLSLPASPAIPVGDQVVDLSLPVSPVGIRE